MLIAAMTTYKKRIGMCGASLYTLMRQSVQLDRICLTLSVDEFPEKEKSFPDDIRLLYKYGLIDIIWCGKNTRSFKKTVYAMMKYPSAYVLSADDDCLYARTHAESYVQYMGIYSDSILTKCGGHHDGIAYGGGADTVYPPSCLVPYARLFERDDIVSTNNDDCLSLALTYDGHITSRHIPGPVSFYHIDTSEMMRNGMYRGLADDFPVLRKAVRTIQPHKAVTVIMPPPSNERAGNIAHIGDFPDVTDKSNDSPVFLTGWPGNLHHLQGGSSLMYLRLILSGFGIELNDSDIEWTSVQDGPHTLDVPVHRRHSGEFIVTRPDGRTSVGGYDILNCQGAIAPGPFNTAYHKQFCAFHDCALVTNMSAPIDAKISVIGDSMMIPMIPVLACMFRYVAAVDNREMHPYMMDWVADSDYVAFVMLQASVDGDYSAMLAGGINPAAFKCS